MLQQNPAVGQTTEFMAATDADGGQASDDFAFENQPSEVDEPIFFDQTTRHMGSIQKNMVLTDSHKNQLLEQGFGGRPGFATKAMQGIGPGSSMPNYSGMGFAGLN